MSCGAANSSLVGSTSTHPSSTRTGGGLEDGGGKSGGGAAEVEGMDPTHFEALESGIETSAEALVSMREARTGFLWSLVRRPGPCSSKDRGVETGANGRSCFLSGEIRQATRPWYPAVSPAAALRYCSGSNNPHETGPHEKMTAET